MRLVKFTIGITMFSALLLGGAQVFSDVLSVGTEGEITFEPSDEPVEVIPPIDEPGVEIDPEIPGGTGPLSIVKVPKINFGVQGISNQDKTYNMVAEMQKLSGSETDDFVPYVSFAQVQDVRGSNDGWELKVSLSDFESNTQNRVLSGAQVTLHDPQLKYGGGNVANKPTIHADGLALIPDAGGVPIMVAAEGKGAGASSVIWGEQQILTAQFEDENVEVVENEAIRLFVPGSTVKDATTYTATLTWELTTTPGENPGEEG